MRACELAQNAQPELGERAAILADTREVVVGNGAWAATFICSGPSFQSLATNHFHQVSRRRSSVVLVVGKGQHLPLDCATAYLCSRRRRRHPSLCVRAAPRDISGSTPLLASGWTAPAVRCGLRSADGVLDIAIESELVIP